MECPRIFYTIRLGAGAGQARMLNLEEVLHRMLVSGAFGA